MARYEGKCPRCGKTVYSDRKDDVAVCDCWQTCPVCGAQMTPYKPDLAMSTYGLDQRRDLAVLKVCTRHSPIFLSSRKPIEVVCT